MRSSRPTTSRCDPATYSTSSWTPRRTMTDFTHLNHRGEAQMVDVTAKEPTIRAARASGLVHCSPQVLTALREGSVPKGDVFAVARIAGINAAKKCADLLPLAHVIGVHGVQVSLTVIVGGVQIDRKSVG